MNVSAHAMCQTQFKNFLHLNESKTGVVFGLGVFFDSELNFVKQVNTVVKTSFYYLRLIAKIQPVLSSRDLEMIIHAFISSRLDYCNVYSGISQSLVNQLQLAQNAAARLLTGMRKRDRITHFSIVAMVTC